MLTLAITQTITLVIWCWGTCVYVYFYWNVLWHAVPYSAQRSMFREMLNVVDIQLVPGSIPAHPPPPPIDRYGHLGLCWLGTAIILLIVVNLIKVFWGFLSIRHLSEWAHYYYDPFSMMTWLLVLSFRQI